jgi:hypothetical protein
MASDISTHDGAVKLMIDSRMPWLAGEHLDGVVELDTERAARDGIKAVKVKLKGSITTYVPTVEYA